jgi:hypothetical protein
MASLGGSAASTGAMAVGAREEQGKNPSRHSFFLPFAYRILFHRCSSKFFS